MDMADTIELVGGKLHVHLSCRDCSGTAWTPQQIASFAEQVALRLAETTSPPLIPVLPLLQTSPIPDSLGKKGPRKRTGCFTCRSKRVKCDEAKVGGFTSLTPARMRTVSAQPRQTVRVSQDCRLGAKGYCSGDAGVPADSVNDAVEDRPTAEPAEPGCGSRMHPPRSGAGPRALPRRGVVPL